MKLTEKQFCKAYTEFYGDEITNVKQIAHIEFKDGEDLFEFAQEIVKLFAITVVVGRSEQLKADVFKLANKLALEGYGFQAVKMHDIHNSL